MTPPQPPSFDSANSTTTLAPLASATNEGLYLPLWRTRGGRWLIVNLALLGMLLLGLGVLFSAQRMMNEILMLLGAYNFTFILLFWVMFVDGLLNYASRFLANYWKMPEWRIPRGVSVVIAYMFILVVILYVSISVIPELSSQAKGLQMLLGKTSHKIDVMLYQLQRSLQLEIPASVKTHLITVRRDLISGLFSLGSQSITPLVYIVMGQLISLYLLFDGAKLTQFVQVLLPHTRRNRLSRGLVLSQVLMYRVMKAYTLQALLSGLLSLAVFKLLGLPYAGLLAFLYALLCFVPVLGTWLGLVIPAMVFIAQLAIMKLFTLVVLFGTYHLFRSRFLNPILFDKRYRLHPLIVLLLLQISIDIAGLWGILMLIPLSVLVVTANRLFSPSRSTGG
jgi:predicted PurR-regulated permease PerM